MPLTTREAALPQVSPSARDAGTAETIGVSAIGSTVEAEDLMSGLHLSYRLVKARDAAPSDGRLSIESPVGMVLRGRRAGDVVTATTPRGDRRLRIIAVQ